MASRVPAGPSRKSATVSASRKKKDVVERERHTRRQAGADQVGAIGDDTDTPGTLRLLGIETHHEHDREHRRGTEHETAVGRLAEEAVDNARGWRSSVR